MSEPPSLRPGARWLPVGVSTSPFRTTTRFRRLKRLRGTTLSFALTLHASADSRLPEVKTIPLYLETVNRTDCQKGITADNRSRVAKKRVKRGQCAVDSL